MNQYPINEIFCSLQGEGKHVGSKSVFVRFAGCNLTCSRDGDAGFDCDTEFTSGARTTFGDIASMVRRCWNHDSHPRVILTGGEPLLHVDDAFVCDANDSGWDVAVETNGTHALPAMTDSWFVSVSPKTAEHTLRIQRASELRYVRNHTQSIPKPSIQAIGLMPGLFLSPAWSDDDGELRRNVDRCIELVKQNPEWRMSAQLHKVWKVQ